MADSYQQMVDRLQTLINRDDAAEQVAATSGNTLNILNDCYGRAERRAYRSEILRLPPFERSVTYTVPAGTSELTIPRGYFGIKESFVSNGDVRLTMDRVSPAQILERSSAFQVALPDRIAYNANRWIIDPPSAQVSITIYYYGELEPINGVTSSDDHWLVNYGDDFLLYLAAVEAGLYFRHLDDTTLAAFEGKASEIGEAIRQQYVEQLESGNRLRWGQATPRPGFFSSGRGNYTGYY